MSTSPRIEEDAIVEKWKSFLNDLNDDNNDTDNDNEKKTEMLAYGDCVPNELRSEIWFIISGASKLMKKHNNNYYKDLSSQTYTKYLNQINKDYERTFVTKDLPNTRQKVQHQLRRMLIAYAHYNPSIGYAQGMNMIAAFILRQFLQHDYFFNANCNFEYNEIEEENENKKENESSFSAHSNSNSTLYTSYSSLISLSKNNQDVIEEKAFWTFVCIMNNISSIYSRSLSGYHLSVKLLLQFLQINLNELWLYLNEMHFETLLTGVFIKWFTSLFAFPSFNLNITQQLWDIWIVGGCDFSVFIRFAFLIFYEKKDELLAMDEIEIPQFCVNSTCIIKDKNWTKHLKKLKMKPVYLNNKNDDDDNKIVEQTLKKQKFVKIDSISINSTRSNNDFGEYRLDIHCGDNNKWSIWKRYTEFEKLYKVLVASKFDMNEVEPLPSKSWVYSSTNPSLMKTRRKKFNLFIQTVLSKYNDIQETNVSSLQILYDFVNYSHYT